MKNKVAIIGGGTYTPLYNHIGLCSFAKGSTARQLAGLFLNTNMEPELHLSKMATSFGEKHSFHTNEDLQNLVNKLKADPQTKIIVLNAAVIDYGWVSGSDDNPRPDSDIIDPYLEKLPKIVEGIRDKDHKHIFLIAFKQTCGLEPNEMYLKGLDLCLSLIHI